ncbi:MAG: DNA mismatch repair protein MutS, partial [Nanoarchaeota archaeon]|nr:DNA mismatch repair protein MutS [Nanoarchaeota archaeon]
MVESILDIPPEQLTPGMRQYQYSKSNHPDCIIMMRMGDFYEMFYEDAVTAAKELEITLTARGKREKRAPLAGIPYHALDNYLARLVKKGYKVAIVEQLEDPKQAQGLVKRGVVRIVTPGTVIDSSMLEEKENNYIICLTAHEDNYALACCDLSTGEFLTKKVDSLVHLMNEISRLSPSECIMPESLLVNEELVSKIKKNCYVNTLEDYYFKTEKAREVLLNHFNLISLDCFGLEEKKFNLAVSGALLKYLLDTQKNNLAHIKKISLQNDQQRMLLDTSTLRNLELIKNIKDGGTRGTLLSVLDKTVTAMGSRLLKKWLKEPLLNPEVIKKRLDALAELNKSVIIREEIIGLLEGVYDLERLISRVNYGNSTPRDLLALRNSLLQVPLIKEKLNDSGLLGEIKSISSMEKVVNLINMAVKEDAPLLIREGGMIKDGFNSELDQLREIKKNSKKYLQGIEEREREKTGINTLRIGYTRVFGYFIEVTKKNLGLVPSSYIRKQTTANSERYITEELKLEEEKILGAEEKIVSLEYDLFQELISQVAKSTAEVQEAALKLAVLDVLCSLAKVAQENGYTKPKFVNENVIQLGGSRHPVLEKIEERYIANDVFISDGEMMIITGANMSGKSSLMRQVALIVLMAQIGSYVPCSDAVLGVVDRIFTRVGAQDDLSSGQSTFMVEMNETAAILHNATSRSLVILDEIGRGTSTFDGVSIAWSVAEHIYNSIKAKTLFSTHYHVMNKLADKFDRINNYYLATKEVRGEIVFLYKLLEGGADQSFGIHVAKLAGMPAEVILRAQEIQLLLENDD